MLGGAYAAVSEQSENPCRPAPTPFSRGAGGESFVRLSREQAAEPLCVSGLLIPWGLTQRLLHPDALRRFAGISPARQWVATF